MALDLAKYLESEIGLKGDDLAGVLAKLAPHADKFEKSFSMQSDYSREMDRLAKMKTELDTKNEQLTADIAEFATLAANDTEGRTDLQNRIDAAEEKAFRLTQKISRYATENGIDPKTVLGDVEAAPEPKKKEAVAFDDKQLRTDFNNVVGGVTSYFLDLQAELPQIAAEHKRLTGEEFDQRAFIAGIKKDIAAKKIDNLDPVKRWEAQYQIQEKRISAASAERESALKNAREEGRIAGLSEAALPGGQQTAHGHESPVFKTSNVAKGSVLQRPQPSQRLSGAVSALSTGKYRTKPAA